MNAVFRCPSCNTPLGTPENPTPDPLPSCGQCGWTRAARPSRPGFPLLAGGAFLAAAFGAAGGWIVGHSLLLVLPCLILFGPMAAVAVGRLFPTGWLLYNLAYSVGFVAAILLLPDGRTLTGSGWYFPAYASVLSLLLGCLVGWLKHSR